MVNFIEAQKPILTRLMKMAGLRPIAIELEPGTTMNIWAPKHHVVKKGTIISTIQPAADADEKRGGRKRRRSPESRPNVVLIHGFAAEGNVTWQFNFGVLVSRYNLYIPDLMFFGKSSTASADRSPDFQAECVAAALARLGVARCDVVGFSYGGMVAFKLAEARPELVRSLCVSGSVVAMTEAVNKETMERLGAGSSAELLMPETLKGLKALLSISMYKKMWFPDRFYKDYLKVMFTNRKERMELLQGLITSNLDAKIPTFQQKIMLIWGEEDRIFDIELAKKMQKQLGDGCFLQGIPKAGHLLHVERPCAYNRQLQRWLAYVNCSQE
ncbi:hypothetical protein ACP70R_026362 [Stipagrostis hirtigluma subsp. patula]